MSLHACIVMGTKGGRLKGGGQLRAAPETPDSYSFPLHFLNWGGGGEGQAGSQPRTGGKDPLSPLLSSRLTESERRISCPTFLVAH